MGGRIVVVGGGHAAGQAVTSLRQEGFKGPITILGDEPFLPYQRPPLSKSYLLGKSDRAKLFFRPRAHYDRLQVEVTTSVRVTGIDRVRKTVSTNSSESLSYDKLLLATGARSRPLPFPCSAQQPILYLRTIHDVDAIQKVLKPGLHVVVIGGGYIGLEFAAAASMLGVKITVLEAAETILGRVTGRQVSDFFLSLHKANGVDIQTGVPISSIETGEKSAFAIVDALGRRIEGDLVVAGVGALPNVELARDSGLECDNGIVVDATARTSDDSIYAAGDCSNHPSGLYGRRIRLESVHNAVEQAKVAAANMAGRPAIHATVPWFWSDQFDVKLQSAGLVQGHDEVIFVRREAEKSFAVFYLLEQKLIAVDAVNSARDFVYGLKRISNTERFQLSEIK